MVRNRVDFIEKDFIGIDFTGNLSTDAATSR